MNMARPTKLTPELQKDICDIISRGNYAKTACEYVDITEATYYDWKNKGEKAKSGKFFEFLKSIKKAEATARVLYLEVIRKAANDGTWQAAGWFLERKYPDEWGRKERTEITGKDGGPIEVKSYAIISPEDWPDDEK